jgi:hypothetical protein
MGEIILNSVPDSDSSEKLKPARSAGVLIFHAHKTDNNVSEVVIIL